jgi:hypothetical protein
MEQGKKIEVLFWSIAFPGFGQLINRKYVKAFLFILLEVIINVKGNVNIVIVESFLWNIEKAIEETNYAWLMFYPCIYLFAMWDAYRDASEEVRPFLFMPFVIAAFFGTLGVIYSSKLVIKGIVLGPVFLSIIFMVIGLVAGNILQKVMIRPLNHAK